jgi:glycosyltransferase involved in cell wall biosynthesis
MKRKLKVSKCMVIPNGVNFNNFYQTSKNSAMDLLGWDQNKEHIIFSANPKRKEKNYPLAKQAIEIVKKSRPGIKVHFLMNINNTDMNHYYNAADILLLTSTTEGSPNVIKEAMACNCPIVATNVGDIKHVIGSTIGCFITTYNKEEIAQKIDMALDYRSRTNGREVIKYLDEEKIAEQLLSVYEKILISNGKVHRVKSKCGSSQ